MVTSCLLVVTKIFVVITLRCELVLYASPGWFKFHDRSSAYAAACSLLFELFEYPGKIHSAKCSSHWPPILFVPCAPLWNTVFI